MLNPNNDRLDYGQILAPPAGYYLDFAVGTTYSLDLDALVGACLALGLSEETDSELMNNPVCLLEALRSTGDKVALFCEGGQIAIHAKVYMIRKYSNSDLYLGSLNASYNAVHGNVEFMIRLRAKNRYLNMDKLTAALFGSEKDGSDMVF